jgi:hypothetical protein
MVSLIRSIAPSVSLFSKSCKTLRSIIMMALLNVSFMG